MDKNNRTIAVTASDTATAEADLAGISIGFETYAPDAATAYRQGSQLSNAIMDALKNAGVPDKSVESRSQNLSKTDFPYDKQPTPQERAAKAYTLSQSWTVHTAAADAARVLHAAVEAGANNSGAIDWEVTDRKGLEAKAAARALVDAHAIAAQMAAGLKCHPRTSGLCQQSGAGAADSSLCCHGCGQSRAAGPQTAGDSSPAGRGVSDRLRCVFD